MTVDGLDARSIAGVVGTIAPTHSCHPSESWDPTLTTHHHFVRHPISAVTHRHLIRHGRAKTRPPNRLRGLLGPRGKPGDDGWAPADAAPRAR